MGNPLLLMDGTVIANSSCTGTWWKLTPDITGSYVTGSWSQIASLPSGYTPRFFSSSVLPDGRVMVEGGEYNAGCQEADTDLGAIYSPSTNSWTPVTPPGGWHRIGDAQSIVLANGTYMQSSCCDRSPSPLSALLNAANLGWSATGSGKFDVYDEEGWTLLPDGSIVTVDAYVGTNTCGSNTERYSPSTGAWATAGNTPSRLADCSNAGMATYEMGPQVLRPDGTMIAFGGTTAGGSGHTVVTPTAIFNSTSKAWSPGSNVPAVSSKNYTLADAPAALLPSGNVLFAASPNYQAFVPPTHFFEVSATTNSVSQVADPTDFASFTSFQWNFLVLPTGQIMALETDGPNVWIYTPSGSPKSNWHPAIASAPSNVMAGATYQISGTQFNGLSQGAAYGDDVQAATNYPIIKIVNNVTGHVFFCTAFGASTTSIAPNAVVTTNFTVPDTLETGPSALYVVANGIASAPVSVSAERGVYAKAADFNGDHKADLLWRNAFGEVVIWLMNGGQISTSSVVATVSNDWTIVGTGDFDGDGKTDILWRNKNGEVALWLMNGTQIKQGIDLGNVSNNWAIVGTGDFNGDGRSDILWRNVNGQVAVWFMNGGTIISSAGLSTPTNAWSIVGTGDFNGDGKTDILWRNTNGEIAIWFMNGSQITSGVVVGTVSNDWTILGTGDFNGDHKSDILWRNANGQVAVWLMNGSTVIGDSGVSAPSNAWSVIGTGDFNGDGKSDILLRNTSGEVTIWEMNGGAILASVGNQQVATPLWTLVQ